MGKLISKCDNLIVYLNKIYNSQTLIICTSDISHINGYFEQKITDDISNKIKLNDNRVIEYLSKSNHSQSEIKYLLNYSSACGCYAIYLFKLLLSNIGVNLYPRLQCYYNSIQKSQNIYLLDFNPKQLVKRINIKDSSESSVSYASLIYSETPYIIPSSQSRQLAHIMTDFEQISLLEFSRQILLTQFNQSNSII